MAFTEGPINSGGGVGMTGGVRFDPLLSAELGWTGTWHGRGLNLGPGRPDLVDNSYLMLFTADLGLHIPTSSAIADPFVQAGGGYALLGADYTAESGLSDGIVTHGPTFDVGVGVDVWLDRHFSLGARVLYRGIYFRAPDVGLYSATGDYVSGVDLDLSVIWHV